MVEMFSKPFLPGKDKLSDFQKIAPDLDTDKIATFIRIISGNNLIIGKLEWYFQQYNLSFVRFQILMDLYFNFNGCNGKDVCPAQLAERFSVKSATISGILSTMEKDGLISRGRCNEDRRRVIVRLTGKGNDFLKDFLPKHFRNMLVLFKKVELDELIELDVRLDKLKTILDDFASEVFPGSNKTDKQD